MAKRASRRRDFAATLNNPTGIPDFSKSKATVTYCAWNEEIGKKGNYHYQVYIYFKNAISWNAAKKNVALIFDFENPHVKQANTTIDDNIHYCTKPCENPSCDKKGCKEVRDGKSQVLAHHEFGERPQQGERTDLGGRIFGEAVALARNDEVEKAQELLITKRPRDWLLNAPKLKAALVDLAPKKKFKHKFTADQFTRPLETDFSKALFFWGPTQCGKTNYALAHFENPLLVSKVDKLRDVNWENHDGIVFDDCSFRHWPGDSIIHILDVDMEREIPCRYKDATIPAGMRRIFTHNERDIFDGPLVGQNQKDAIARRYRLVPIQEDVRVGPPSITIDEFNASGGFGEE